MSLNSTPDSDSPCSGASAPGARQQSRVRQQLSKFLSSTSTAPEATAESSAAAAAPRRSASSFRVRLQIKAAQLLCSSTRIFERFVRNLGGEDAVFLYIIIQEFFENLAIEHPNRGRKIVKSLINVLVELFVLYTQGIFTISDFDRCGEQIAEAVGELRSFMDDNHENLGFKLNEDEPTSPATTSVTDKDMDKGLKGDGDNDDTPPCRKLRYEFLEPPKADALAQLKQKFAETIRRIHTAMMSSIALHIGSSSARKLQEVADKLCADGPLGEMCNLLSPATDAAQCFFIVLDRITEKEGARRELTET